MGYGRGECHVIEGVGFRYTYCWFQSDSADVFADLIDGICMLSFLGNLFKNP